MISKIEFDTDWEQTVEKLGWLISRLESEPAQRAAIIEAILKEVQDFLTKWRAQSPDGSAMRMLARIEEMASSLEQSQHFRFCTDLGRVVDLRMSCGVADCMLDRDIKIASDYVAMSPDRKREFQARRVTPYDPAEQFRKNEVWIDKIGKAYKEALAKLSSDWPRRVDDAVKRRLAQDDLGDISDWQEELYALTPSDDEEIGKESW